MYGSFHGCVDFLLVACVIFVSFQAIFVGFSCTAYSFDFEVFGFGFFCGDHVDAKCAPSVKHTESRTSWLHTRKESRDVPVNFF
jgi:hypothetical protein